MPEVGAGVLTAGTSIPNPSGMNTRADELKAIHRAMSAELDTLRFGLPITHVYNPLVYAREPAERYFEWVGSGPIEAVFVGMNPGPYGMAQTGVPFGTVSLVRDWLGIEGKVGKPEHEHPRRPVQGFACPREEVSGTRLWGWALARFGTPQRFFERFFVANYCPLVFMEASGRNRTPDKLSAAERKGLFEACDRALAGVIDTLSPGMVIGIGKFAEDRARSLLRGRGIPVGRILHPSPASPIANRGWREQAEKQLLDLGVL